MQKIKQFSSKMRAELALIGLILTIGFTAEV